LLRKIGSRIRSFFGEKNLEKWERHVRSSALSLKVPSIMEARFFIELSDIQKVSDLKYQALYGALLLINKLLAPAQIIGSKLFIGLEYWTVTHRT
jgi:hypothetical protein